MNVLVTGARGFIGRNLTAHLRTRGGCAVALFDVDNSLGELRAVQVEYLQAGMSQRVEDGPLTAKLRWKLDTAQSGPSLVLGDIGTHADQLLRFVSGRRIERLSADLGAVVPGRKVHDWGAFLLRMGGEVRGTLTVSQALAGAEK